MNEGKTNRTRKRRVAALALACILGLLASPPCPLNCSGADCRMAQTASMHGEECHGAAETDFAQIRSAKIMVCDAPALAAQTESSAEYLRKISRLSAIHSTAEAVNSTALTDLHGDRELRGQLLREPDLHAAEASSILALRI